jgi:leucyl-tRNA synthetase
MYKNGLAYKRKAKVNWCDSCQTVLANEQAEGGVCDRCGNTVIQKDLEQWFFKITDFIEDQVKDGRAISGLLSGLNKVDWPESTKAAQRNWIGRSEGTEVSFKAKASDHYLAETIKVFTTRVDTIFGCTYVVLAPEQKLVQDWKEHIKNWDEVENYIKECRQKTDLQRTDLNKDKTGVRLEGIYAVNPFNGWEIEVWLADYVLASYGTGSVMAVPAHDERDFEFAKKYDLDIKTVILDKKVQPLFDDGEGDPICFTDDGLLQDSGDFSGLDSAAARTKMGQWLENNKSGKRTINYRLRDWLVSRQRYWGAPIPIVYCEHCGALPVPEEQLPVLLPDDVGFLPTGESPLVNSVKFHDVKCPLCGAPARRENDTMDTFVCSSWYYLRYADPKNSERFASEGSLKTWLPVDLYLGGAEHSVLHLLYARFFTKALASFGYVDFDEPFLKLRHQGIILAEDGTKMSKSKGNVVNPDEVIERNGADALRIYEMFMGPLEDMKPWNTKGIVGIARFLDKVVQLSETLPVSEDKAVISLLHKTIKKVGSDIEEFKFNTAISALMIFVNAMADFRSKNQSWPLQASDYSKFIQILAPFAPHLAEELWEKAGHKGSIFLEAWPEYSEELSRDETISLAVQINGKLRGVLPLPADIDEAAALASAKANEAIAKYLAGAEIIKVIFVKGKLLNIVVKQ